MEIKDLYQYEDLAKDMLEVMKPYCTAIYLGGSMVYPEIKNAHDIDFIFFSGEKLENKCITKMIAHQYKKQHMLPANFDFFQQRTTLQEEHAYGSYINKKMIKLAGEDVGFEFDVIGKDRKEYVGILLETIVKLNSREISNQKRWYQVLCGYFILQNNSYDLTEEQLNVLNEVHDQVEGWEQYKIGVKEALEAMYDKEN